MGRRTFLRNSLLTAGSVLLGGSAIFRFLKDGEMEEPPCPTTIETICQGNGKNVLVLMSAGTRQGNTDRLTDAYIKRLSEKGHSMTKVYFHIISGVLGGKEAGTYLAGIVRGGVKI